MVLDFEPKFILLSPEEIDYRRSICLECDERDNGMCEVCGCLIATRIRYKEKDCPLGKWENEEYMGD